MLDHIEFKSNKVAFFGILISTAITAIIGTILVGLSISNPPTFGNTSNIGIILLLSLVSFIAIIVQAVFQVMFIYNSHNNSRVMADEYDILPWNAWATCVFYFIPIVSIFLFNYSIYKIMKAANVAKGFFIAFYLSIATAVVSSVSTIITFGMNSAISNPDGVDQATIDAYRLSLGVDLGITLVLTVVTLTTLYGIFKTQKAYQIKEAL